MNNTPKKEYDLWLPLFNNPMDVANPFKNTKKCFGGIMR